MNDEEQNARGAGARRMHGAVRAAVRCTYGGCRGNADLAERGCVCEYCSSICIYYLLLLSTEYVTLQLYAVKLYYAAQYYSRNPTSYVGVLQLQLPQETKKCIITDLSSSNRSS